MTSHRDTTHEGRVRSLAADLLDAGSEYVARHSEAFVARKLETEQELER